MRFQVFTDAELDELWRGLVFDDGCLYLQERESVEFALVAEIEREWLRRGNPLNVTLTGAPTTTPAAEQDMS